MSSELEAAVIGLIGAVGFATSTYAVCYAIRTWAQFYRE